MNNSYNYPKINVEIDYLNNHYSFKMNNNDTLGDLMVLIINSIPDLMNKKFIIYYNGYDITCHESFKTLLGEFIYDSNTISFEIETDKNKNFNFNSSSIKKLNSPKKKAPNTISFLENNLFIRETGEKKNSKFSDSFGLNLWGSRNNK